MRQQELHEPGDDARVTATYTPPALAEIGEFTEDTLGLGGTNYDQDAYFGG